MEQNKLYKKVPMMKVGKIKFTFHKQGLFGSMVNILHIQYASVLFSLSKNILVPLTSHTNGKKMKWREKSQRVGRMGKCNTL